MSNEPNMPLEEALEQQREEEATVVELQRRRHPVRRLLLFLGLCLLMLAAVLLFLFRDELNLDAARRFVSYLNVSSSGKYGEFSYDFSPTNAFCPFGDGLAVASVTGVTTYSDKGTERQTEQVTLNVPVVQAGGKLLLAYDVGGREIRVLHETKGTVAHLTAEDSVLDADIAPDGAFCYIDRGSGYKTVISVVDKKQNLIYRWDSATRYFSCCTVNDGAELVAAVSLDVTDGVYESSLVLFNTKKEEPQSTTVLGNDLILDVEWCGNTVVAVGESAVYFVAKDGTIRGVYDLSAYTLQDFALGGDGFIALQANKNKVGAPVEILTVDLEGKELACLRVGGDVLSISACSRYLAVLADGKLTVYTSSLSPYASTEQIGLARAALMREDGTALLLEPTSGHLYIP